MLNLANNQNTGTSPVGSGNGLLAKIGRKVTAWIHHKRSDKRYNEDRDKYNRENTREIIGMVWTYSTNERRTYIFKSNEMAANGEKQKSKEFDFFEINISMSIQVFNRIDQLFLINYIMVLEKFFFFVPFILQQIIQIFIFFIVVMSFRI